jgi:hypothetical protein
MNLEKATITKLKRQTDPTAPDVPEGDPVPVQFNPASLRLNLTNQVEGGQTRGRQQRQFAGNSSTEISFDLHFDTADEGTSESPVSVRTRTALLEQFVVPGLPNSQERVAPPRVQFSWGGPQGLRISGVITSLSFDFDLFAASPGVPLRAKVGVTIREQNARYELAVRQQAQAVAQAPPPGGGGGGGPGTQGGGRTDRTGLALGGESLADFAARMGLDPGAWRGLAGGVSLGAGGTLSLTAGVAIDFSAQLSAGVGLGLHAGFEAGVGTSLEASFGLGVSGELDAGFKLAAAGGVTAAVETVAIVEAETTRRQALASFGAPATVQAAPGALALPAAASLPVARPSMPEQARPPLQSTGLPSLEDQAAAPPAPPPPRVDPRAVTFGRGVPLRPRVPVPEGAGPQPITRPGRPPYVPVPTDDPGAPPWVQLPAGYEPRAAADRAQADRRPPHLCGCFGACSHRGGRRWA